ncbi:triphosphoribosyl-dephospho-CoA synthase CitG [Clostridium saccharobutylicum]|uniref:Probable 2-(5''-triphosphoribosyl)-3'-dephosphocoenzyme-A synthase n=1 Tax=Clostridium saccharobutylicum DSM 13864 TaxID=1345695 RepID=U5MYC3_CLOSA|nr:triphosphoribosyl-dephospho-CoA synthase CitG [Clostridium saccharobutylicum]AGX44452.1 citXG: protein CitXG [Clostridium saccharobutylicum DSM 13864]AQR91747.1 2-(5''-triphosphoribosyl)-3'-dephosphocoenzyme-A synthase [Clostridium saccharobutylicum]AQS01649.1 2-(5''-triphosphoribosyl)-3'-dephosphocoenzyme-A synthase [Clostridium saccharobutylicum]AQS11259.1 2-(5''-triphosphoribosyl)-3'-dephosphocoenzyme-A synthase [Clostridium saccharobutylicum]AQS15632.1 2-(5''-triphosphoribosyl)-3'-depho
MDNIKAYTVNEMAMEISSLAVQAMIYEVSCYPSPGLVSPVSCGAHKDMDFFTFIDSTSVLSKYLTLFVQEGFSNKSYKEIFDAIRKIGITAEQDMFVKTKGINTHKGMLFLMGITCAAIGKAIYEKKGFECIQSIIKEMTTGIVEKELIQLNHTDAQSHGEKLFFKYKTDGVRGEVERGIPTVFQFSLDFYKENFELNIKDRLVHTLIGIMQICDDSTILHRHSVKILEEVKETAREVIAMGGMKTTKGREKIDNLCTEFVERNISPGGSADLLGVTVFLSLVEEYMKNVQI